MNPTTTFAPGDLVEFRDDYGPDGLHAKEGDRVTVSHVDPIPPFGGSPLVHFTGTATPAAYSHRLRKVAPVVTAKPDFAKGDRVVFGEDYGSVCRQGDTGLVVKVESALGRPGVDFVNVLRDADGETYGVYDFRLRTAHPEPEALVAEPGDRVVVTSPVYNYDGQTKALTEVQVGDEGVILSGPDSDGDYTVEVDRLGYDECIDARGLVMAPAPEPEALVYTEGDLVTVVSDAPTFKSLFSRGPVPSSAKKGNLYRVALVHADGDLNLTAPEDPNGARVVVSPEHVEPYVAPAIFISSTPRRNGRMAQAAHLNGWATFMSSPGHAFVEFAPTDLTPYLDAVDKAVADLRAAIEKGA